VILPEIPYYPLVLKTGMIFVSIQIFVVEQSWPALLNSLLHRLGGLLRVSNMSPALRNRIFCTKSAQIFQVKMWDE